jgi:hypothetical protein
MNELQERLLHASTHGIEGKVNEAVQNPSPLARNQRTDEAWRDDLRCEDKN